MFFFALPFKVDRSCRELPLITIALIAVNVVAYFGTIGYHTQVIMAVGFRPNALGFITWLPAMFLHADPIFHLGGNMFFLWLFGSVVEDGIGRLKYLGLYFAGGLVSALVHGLMVAWFMPQFANVPAIGASGALAGVIGMFAVRYYKNKMRLAWLVWILVYIKWGTWEIPSMIGVGLWGLRELFSGLSVIAGSASNVANWAHLGGLAFGIAVGMILGEAKVADREYLGEEAARLEAEGTHGVAAAKYGELAEAEPDNPDVLLPKAFATLADGRTEGVAPDVAKSVDALRRLGRGIEIPDAFAKLRAASPLPLDARTLQTIASTAEAVQRLDVAARAYYELLVGHPGTREAERAHFRLAHVYLAEGKTAEARQTWAAFLQCYPVSEWLPYADRAFGTAS